MKIGIQEASDDLFSNIRDGIFLMDNQGKIMQINKAVEDRFKSDFKNFDITDLQKIKITSFIKEYQFEQNYQDYETSYIDTKGKRYYALLNQSTIYQNNYSIGKILIISNITKRKEAEEQIRKQKEQIEFQKGILENKNKEITDSIVYGKYIQEAIFTSEEYLNDLLEDFFVYYRPKDIVSGDFYRAYKTSTSNIIWIVADCTGHGVPGAFLSMLGNAFLNEIIIENEIEEANKIMDEMRTKIINALGETGEAHRLKDGMDMTICIWDQKHNITICRR